MIATNGPCGVILAPDHARLAPSNGSITCMGIGIVSEGNGPYPASGEVLSFRMDNAKTRCHTTTGKGTTSARVFRRPRVPLFGKRLAILIRDARVPKATALGIDNGNLGDTGIAFRAIGPNRNILIRTRDFSGGNK